MAILTGEGSGDKVAFMKSQYLPRKRKTKKSIADPDVPLGVNENNTNAPWSTSVSQSSPSLAVTPQSLVALHANVGLRLGSLKIQVVAWYEVMRNYFFIMKLSEWAWASCQYPLGLCFFSVKWEQPYSLIWLLRRAKEINGLIAATRISLLSGRMRCLFTITYVVRYVWLLCWEWAACLLSEVF